MRFTFSAHRTDLKWKALPSRSLASRGENAAQGHTVSKRYDQLPLLVIAKSKNPCGFKNIKIPITYASQQKAWINTDIFLTGIQIHLVPG